MSESKTEMMKQMRKQHLELLKQQRNKLYYENKRKNERFFCGTCYCYVDKYRKDAHLESNKHKKRLELEGLAPEQKLTQKNAEKNL